MVEAAKKPDDKQQAPAFTDPMFRLGNLEFLSRDMDQDRARYRSHTLYLLDSLHADASVRANVAEVEKAIAKVQDLSKKTVPGSKTRSAELTKAEGGLTKSTDKLHAQCFAHITGSESLTKLSEVSHHEALLLGMLANHEAKPNNSFDTNDIDAAKKLKTTMLDTLTKYLSASYAVDPKLKPSAAMVVAEKQLQENAALATGKYALIPMYNRATDQLTRYHVADKFLIGTQRKLDPKPIREIAEKLYHEESLKPLLAQVTAKGNMVVMVENSSPLNQTLLDLRQADKNDTSNQITAHVLERFKAPEIKALLDTDPLVKDNPENQEVVASHVVRITTNSYVIDPNLGPAKATEKAIGETFKKEGKQKDPLEQGKDEQLRPSPTPQQQKPRQPVIPTPKRNAL